MQISLHGTGNDSTAALADATKRCVTGGEIELTGEHLVGELQLIGLAGVKFTGTGKITRLPGAAYTMQFDQCIKLVIQGLRFDMNGIERYGGVKFYGCDDVALENNTLYNGDFPPPVEGYDRYAFVFGRGVRMSRQVRVERNSVHGLQLEFDHIEDVGVVNNTVLSSAQTGAIGFFSLGDGSVVRRANVAGNIISDPYGSGIAFTIDPPADSYVTFENLQIYNNTIFRTAANPRNEANGIVIGAANTQVPTKGNSFYGVVVNGNKFVFADGPTKPASFIRMMASEKSNFVFENVTVGYNVVNNETKTNIDAYSMDLRFLRSAHVARNEIDFCAAGLALVNGKSVVVENNKVNASWMAYANDYSDGYNVFVSNEGKPVSREQPSNLDVMED